MNITEARPARLMMLPASVAVQVLFLGSAPLVLPYVHFTATSGLEAVFRYCAIYAGLFVLVYAGLVLWLRLHAGDLVTPEDIRVGGVSLPWLYARTGLGAIDGVGLACAAVFFVICLFQPILWFVAPFPLISAFGFLGGLLVGRTSPWPLERRGGR